MNATIPSDDYLVLKDSPRPTLDEILDNMYNQIRRITSHPGFNPENVNFELEIRLRNYFTRLDVEAFVNEHPCIYAEFIYNETETTRKRLRCSYEILQEVRTTTNDDNSANGTTPETPVENTENAQAPEGKEDPKKESSTGSSYRYFSASALLDFIKTKADKEITDSDPLSVEYTRKLTIIKSTYFIFDLALNIEIPQDTKKIERFLKNQDRKRIRNGHFLEIIMLESMIPTIKKRRSFLFHKDIRIDVTHYDDEISQLEIDFSRNIYHDRKEIHDLVQQILRRLNWSIYVTDYLFCLLPDFEFQKPITPSLDIILQEAQNWIDHKFYIAAKTDGYRCLILQINYLIFSINENFKVQLEEELPLNVRQLLVLDCERIDDVFVPFDVLYWDDQDLRKKAYAERLACLHQLDFTLYNEKLRPKEIKECQSFQEVQEYIEKDLRVEKGLPNDGIILTDRRSTYVENTKVYKIKTENTVDLRFNGRYFFTKTAQLNKAAVNVSLDEYKRICQLYHTFKQKYWQNESLNPSTNGWYYEKQVMLVNDIVWPAKTVWYVRVKDKKKLPFIIEYNLDTGKFVRIRPDKFTPNSLNTFHSVQLASYQKVNLEMFSATSTLLMRKFHNRVKLELLQAYKGHLLDIGTGQGGDLHKWKSFSKIMCIEPEDDKIKMLRERVAASEIKNRITVVQNSIQEVTLTDHYDTATCLFALNDFTYSSIADMLSNLQETLRGTFILLFFDEDQAKEDIESPSITYRHCIDTTATKVQIKGVDKQSPISMIGLLRYLHRDCDNIMYINISDSNLTNHYECALSSTKIIQLFKKYHFKLLDQSSVKPFNFLNASQILYTSYLKILKFSNLP